MFCSACGTQNDDNSSFCKKCGNKLNTNGENLKLVANNGKPKTPPSLNKISHIIRYCIIAVVSIGLVGLIVYLLVFKLNIFESKSDKANKVKLIENMSTVQLAVEQFRLSAFNRYPSSLLSEGDCGLVGGGKPFREFLPQLLRNPYDSISDPVVFSATDTVDWRQVKPGQVLVIAKYDPKFGYGYSSEYRIMGKAKNKPLQEILTSSDDESKRVKLGLNMRELQNMLATGYNKGLYPIDNKSHDFTSAGGEFSQYRENLRNPYDSTADAVVISLQDPPMWSLIAKGQVVYIPNQIDYKLLPDGFSEADCRKMGFTIGYAKGYKILGKADDIISFVLTSSDDCAKEPAIEDNMRELLQIVETYYDGQGGYPIDMVFFNHVDWLNHDIHKYIQNPYDTIAIPVVVSQINPPDWTIIKPGQLVYIPEGIDSKTKLASGYTIMGMGSKRPLALKFQGATVKR